MIVFCASSTNEDLAVIVTVRTADHSILRHFTKQVSMATDVVSMFVMRTVTEHSVVLH